MTLDQIVARTLRDIAVELGSEFDRNFERQAFFTSAWQRRRSPVRQGGATLIATGALRRSVQRPVETTATSVAFGSDLPHAAIHNEGGEIPVTDRMKRFFWYKYREAVGAFQRKKNGELSASRRQQQLSTVADFWRAMALKKVGSPIRIPQRQFLGTHPDLEKVVESIIADNLERWYDSTDFTVAKN